MLRILIVLAWLAACPVLVFSADPTLPSANVDITTGWCELGSCGTQRTATTNATLDTAIANAACGDEIVITAGSDIDATDDEIIFTDKDCSDSQPIIVRSSGEASLPAKGIRICPDTGCSGVTANMAKISRTGDGTDDPIIRIAQAADNWWFVGIEFEEKNTTTATTPNRDLIRVGYDSACGTTAGTRAQRTIFERVYIHGTTTGGTHKGMVVCGDDLAIIDSFIDEIHCQAGCGADLGMGYHLFNTAGPVLIQNNYIFSGAENAFHSDNKGSDGTNAFDLTFRRNYVGWYTKWDPSHGDYAGIDWHRKNLLEFKGWTRVLVEQNLFDRSWDSDGQQNMLTIKTQGNNPSSDFTFKNNIVTNIDNRWTWNITADSDGGTVSNTLIEENLFFKVSDTFCQLQSEATVDLDNTIFRHNTIHGATGEFCEYSDHTGTTFIFKDNLITGSSGFKLAGQSCGVNSIDNWSMASIDIDNNGIIGTATCWGTTTGFTNHQRVDADSDVGFTNNTPTEPAHFQLLNTSDFYAGGTKGASDGTDMGVTDWTTILDVWAMAKDGDWTAATSSVSWSGVSQGSPSWPGVTQGVVSW